MNGEDIYNKTKKYSIGEGSKGIIMKDKFSEFYYKPDFDKLWNECDFVFDTSIFIDLYYQKKQSNEFLAILEDKIPERIWMPYQIGLEYHRHRVDAIKEIEHKYDSFLNIVKNYKKSIKTSIKNLSKSHLIDIKQYVDVNKINDKLNEINETILDELLVNIEENPDFFEDDQILNKLTELYTGRIGNNYSESELNKLYEEGELRTKYKIPPSFEDKGHGDFILWKQILDYVKTFETTSKDIIFVTSDTKRDWWFMTKNKKDIGPHPSLIKEFLATGNDFYMYKLSDFLENSKIYLNADVDDEVIETAKEIEYIRDNVDDIDGCALGNLSAMAEMSSRAQNAMINVSSMAPNLSAMAEMSSRAQNAMINVSSMAPNLSAMAEMSRRAQRVSDLMRCGLIKDPRLLIGDDKDESADEDEHIDNESEEDKDNTDESD